MSSIRSPVRPVVQAPGVPEWRSRRQVAQRSTRPVPPFCEQPLRRPGPPSRAARCPTAGPSPAARPRQPPHLDLATPSGPTEAGPPRGRSPATSTSPQLHRPCPASQQPELVANESPVFDQLVFIQHTRHGCDPRRTGNPAFTLRIHRNTGSPARSCAPVISKTPHHLRKRHRSRLVASTLRTGLVGEGEEGAGFVRAEPAGHASHAEPLPAGSRIAGQGSGRPAHAARPPHGAGSQPCAASGWLSRRWLPLGSRTAASRTP